MARTPADRLTKAKVGLLLDHPFFGTLATRLPNVMDPRVKTCVTNGESIRWNPAFMDKLSDAEIRFVIAHEVLHVANGHTWRRGERDKAAWNVSTDLAINQILTNAGLTATSAALMPHASQAGKSAESLYQAPAPTQKNGRGAEGEGEGKEGDGKPDPKGKPTKGKGAPGKGDGTPSSEPGDCPDPGGCGGVEDAPEGEAKAQEAEWKIAVAQAAMAAKAQGKMPRDLERMVTEIVNPRVAWETVLRDFVERTARNDYNWSVPNRRHFARGIILPSLVSEELPAIVVAIDTSGSIGAAELDQFAAEVSAVLGAYETTIHIVYADAQVCHTHTVSRAELPLKLEPKGGGGTDFRPVFEWVEQEGIQPAALVYLTDGWGTFPTADALYPVLWVMTTDKVAPRGETIKMNKA